jgi:hypothetical protein
MQDAMTFIIIAMKIGYVVIQKLNETETESIRIERDDSGGGVPPKAILFVAKARIQQLPYKSLKSIL